MWRKPPRWRTAPKSTFDIGFDDSEGALAAVEAVAARNWREESEVRIVAVTSPIHPSIVGRIVPPIAHLVKEVNDYESQWLGHAGEKAARLLRRHGLRASLHMHSVNPKEILVEEAERWHADSIFVGANAFGDCRTRAVFGRSAQERHYALTKSNRVKSPAAAPPSAGIYAKTVNLRNYPIARNT